MIYIYMIYIYMIYIYRIYIYYMIYIYIYIVGWGFEDCKHTKRSGKTMRKPRSMIYFHGGLSTSMAMFTEEPTRISKLKCLGLFQ